MTSGSALAGRHVHLSAEERVARGKAARKEAPRSSHGKWEAAANRFDPIALLEEQEESRVPDLVPIRYGRMLDSPFAFFRGAALIMAADLAPTPRSGVNVQLCGDAHLSNFGVFGSPERQLMFDINDFDETLPGPWEWDVKRLAASVEVLGRDLAFSRADRREIIEAGVREYRNTMRKAAGMQTLAAWYDHLDTEQILGWVRDEVREKRLAKEELKRAEKHVAKARTRDSMRVFAKRADEIDGQLRIVADPPLIVPIDDLLPPGTDRDEAEEWCARWSRRTGDRSPTTTTRSRSSSTSTPHEKSWAWVASEPVPGSTCSSAGTTRIPCSCSRRKRTPRCWSGSSGRARTPTTAGGSWSASD
jgi:hypothetical protein